MECLSYSPAESFDLQKIDSLYKQLGDYKIERIREVMRITHLPSAREIYCFKIGTLVSWGYKRYQMDEIIELIQSTAAEAKTAIITDEFSVSMGDKLRIYPDDYFNVDRIILDEDDKDIRLAISFGLSISIKLMAHEKKLEQLITKHQNVRKVSRKKLNAILIEIIETKNKINLNTDFLYQPKYFWSHPNLELHYTLVSNYLDIKPRVNTINQQLESLNETFQLFNSYLVNEHSHYLEIVIVVLICAEIIFSLLNLHLHI